MFGMVIVNAEIVTNPIANVCCLRFIWSSSSLWRFELIRDWDQFRGVDPEQLHSVLTSTGGIQRPDVQSAFKSLVVT